MCRRDPVGIAPGRTDSRLYDLLRHNRGSARHLGCPGDHPRVDRRMVVLAANFPVHVGDLAHSLDPSLDWPGHGPGIFLVRLCPHSSTDLGVLVSDFSGLVHRSLLQDVGGSRIPFHQTQKSHTRAKGNGRIGVTNEGIGLDLIVAKENSDP